MLLIITGCSESDDVFTNTIESFKIPPGSYSYKLFINDEDVGTNYMTINDSLYISFGNITYSQVTGINENVTLNSKNQTFSTYTKDTSDGYMYLSDDNPNFTLPYVQFPVAYNSELYGPYSAISSENYTLYVKQFYSTYTNKLGFEFNNVMQAEDENGLIKLYFNADYFIIQKEDSRYDVVIQSLML